MGMKDIQNILRNNKYAYTLMPSVNFVYRYSMYSHDDLRMEKFNGRLEEFEFERICFKAISKSKFPFNCYEEIIDETLAERFMTLGILDE